MLGTVSGLPLLPCPPVVQKKKKRLDIRTDQKIIIGHNNFHLNKSPAPVCPCLCALDSQGYQHEKVVLRNIYIRDDRTLSCYDKLLHYHQ